MVVNLSKLKSDFRTVTVTMYQTNEYKQVKKGKNCRRCSCYLLIATVAESLQTFHPHWSAHTGTHDGGGLFCTLFWGYLVLFEAEPCFGVKIISWLTRPHYKQDKSNTPAYRNPAHCLQVLFLFFLWICLLFISWSKKHTNHWLELKVSSLVRKQSNLYLK